MLKYLEVTYGYQSQMLLLLTQLQLENGTLMEQFLDMTRVQKLDKLVNLDIMITIQ